MKVNCAQNNMTTKYEKANPEVTAQANQHDQADDQANSEHVRYKKN